MFKVIELEIQVVLLSGFESFTCSLGSRVTSKTSAESLKGFASVRCDIIKKSVVHELVIYNFFLLFHIWDHDGRRRREGSGDVLFSRNVGR